MMKCLPIIAVSLVALLLFSGCIEPQTPPTPQPQCGNLECDLGEIDPSAANYCPRDCGYDCVENDGGIQIHISGNAYNVDPGPDTIVGTADDIIIAGTSLSESCDAATGIATETLCWNKRPYAVERTCPTGVCNGLYRCYQALPCGGAGQPPCGAIPADEYCFFANHATGENTLLALGETACNPEAGVEEVWTCEYNAVDGKTEFVLVEDCAAKSPAELCYQTDDAFFYGTTECLPPPDITTGLVLHFPFDADVNPVVDESGSGNDGAIYDGAVWDAGGMPEGSGSYVFTNAGDYLSVADNASLEPSTALTVATWVSINGYNTGKPVNMIVDKQDGSTGWRLTFVSSSGSANYKKFQGVLWTDVGTYTINSTTLASVGTATWYHVALVYDGSNLKIYVNGVEESAPGVAASGNIKTNAAPLKVGEYSGGTGYWMNGKVDDVRLYSRALAANDVLGLYGEGFCAIACSGDAECYDSDPLTTDTCANAGTCAAVCSNTQCAIACSGIGDCPSEPNMTCLNAGGCESECCVVVCGDDDDCTGSETCVNANECGAMCVPPCPAVDATGYCGSSFPAELAEVEDDWVARVQFAGQIDNSTGVDMDGADLNGYGDYTSHTAGVYSGQTYDLTLTIGQEDSWVQCGKAWIDWDQSGVLDFDEGYDLGCCTTAGCDVVGSITVPGDAAIGPTLMRVSEQWDSAPGACSIDYGETEDYTVCASCSTPPACLSDIDCTVPGETCAREGTCAATCCPVGCEGDVDCGSGNICIDDGYCSAYCCPVECSSDADCTGIDICVDAMTCSAVCSPPPACTDIDTGLYSCADVGDTTDGEYMLGMEFAGINRPSDDDGGYFDATNRMTTSLVPGSTYPITVTLKTGWSDTYTECATAWFDWDNDLALEGTERTDIGCCSGVNCQVSADITVPGDAYRGSILMRVAGEYSSYPVDACNVEWNEVEEYTACLGVACTVACSTDAECDDSNPGTLDTCGSPGECGAVCDNCPSECGSDAECDDSNPGTLDTCENPGVCGAVCNNCAVACTTDADCAGNYICAAQGTCGAVCSPPIHETISIGEATVCTIMPDGTVWCWGMGNPGLGDGTYGNSTVPVQVLLGPGQPVTNAVDVALGNGGVAWINCVLRGNGDLWCWGQNECCAFSSDPDLYTHWPVLTDWSVTDATAGPQHLCSNHGDTMGCTGYNGSGELGNGQAYPTTGSCSDVSGASDWCIGVGGVITGVFDADGGNSYTCAVKTDGTVWCWGNNWDGMLGNPNVEIGDWTSTPVPVLMSGGTQFGNAISVSVRNYHTCALRSDGTVWCWGNNEYGQFGDGSTTSRVYPVQASVPGTAIDVGVGNWSTCAVRAIDGSVWCWGACWDGECGYGGTSERHTPVQVVKKSGGALLDAVEVAAGDGHACAKLSNGDVYCWGRNWYGALGDGSTNPSNTAVSVCPTSFTPACTADANCGTGETCLSGGGCNAVCCTVACSGSADCSDGDPGTSDICRYPGTCNSRCANRPCSAVCTTAADCDDADPATLDFCNDPGCEGSCSHCTPECTALLNDPACDDCDTDPGACAYTLDICQMVGTCDAYCHNCISVCDEDADCGAGYYCDRPGSCGASCLIG